nr:TPA_inf: conotoxin precursor O1 [Conus ebraeus]
MKLTCMMIVAVLFLTAWTFVTADDSKNALENRGGWGKPFPEARDEMKNPKASELRECSSYDEYCFPGIRDCCSGFCFIICIPELPDL